MARVDVRDLPRLRVEPREEEGDVLPGGHVLADGAVDARHRLRHRLLHPVAAHGGAQHGHEQGRPRALAGDVAQRHQELALVQREVVVVAADRAAGPVRADHAVAADHGRRIGQEAALDLRRHPHVLLQPALLHALLEQAHVLDLGRGHVRERGDDARVLLVEGPHHGQRVEVHEADDGVLVGGGGGEPQGGAQRRAQFS